MKSTFTSKYGLGDIVELKKKRGGKKIVGEVTRVSFEYGTCFYFVQEEIDKNLKDYIYSHEVNESQILREIKD